VGVGELGAQIAAAAAFVLVERRAPGARQVDTVRLHGSPGHGRQVRSSLAASSRGST
jgi:hypothetical protein